VYVASPDGYLYALNAGDGTLLWKSLVAQPSATVSDYFNWSSPVVANGHVYVGVSSQCDAPLVRGGVEQYDQGTGALQNSYWGTPPGVIGDSVWGTPAIGPTGDVYVTTGNGPISSDALSIVRLDGSSLAKVSRWQLPSANFKHDYDFGASPTTFTADLGSGPVPMVGACSKNGVFYALRADNLAAGPVWTYQVGNPSGSGQISCLSAAVWDGTNLYVSGPATTINGTAYQGSVQALNPATGTPVWQDGRPGVILGTPGIDGAGVLAAGTYTLGSTATNSLYLINSSDGSSLATIDTKNSKVFSQPVFADGYLVIASTGRGLFVFRP
jgi:outer membrane protein assembly factor BamB